MSTTKISIGHQNGGLFFHVMGDNTRYFDLTSLERSHPELSNFINENRYDLERNLLQRREELDAYNYV